MPVVLYRVDDRLVHGQVVVGWGQPMGVERIVLVDDTVAASPWEQDLYRMAIPGSVTFEVASAAEAPGRLVGWDADPRRTFVITADLATMRQLQLGGGGRVREINIGGLHHQPGRTERLPYVFLTDDEFALIQAMAAAGARVRAQDVPTATSVGAEALRR